MPILPQGVEMTNFYTNNWRINGIHPLIKPHQLLDELPIQSSIQKTITDARRKAGHIIQQQDSRLLVIVGPCSIHDPKAAIDYAQRLKKCADQFQNQLHIIMRVYFEKPRTRIGWKGLINDPHLDRSFNINEGLYIARKLLLDINQLGLPTASEFLDPIIPQYIADLTSWSAIGARTVESQLHRELGSGLSMPVGFKNSTTGNIQVAVNALYAARQPHHFLGISEQGQAAIVSTNGNQDTHIILRGGKTKSNYDTNSIEQAINTLKMAQLTPHVMIDCSHGNSDKNDYPQQKVLETLCQQIIAHPQEILGVMIESNLVEGHQELIDKRQLLYGQSITDACIGWKDTEIALSQLADAVEQC